MMTRAKRWPTAGFTAITPWRVGRVVALVALLLAGTTMYFSMSYGEGRNPSVSSETTRASHSPVNSGPEDPEDAEAPFDELMMGFIGIPAPTKGAIAAPQTYTLPEIFEDDLNERVYDEMMRIGFVGISAPRSEAADAFLPVGQDR